LEVLTIAADLGIDIVTKRITPTKPSLLMFYSESMLQDGTRQSIIHCEYLLPLFFLPAGTPVFDPGCTTAGSEPTSLCGQRALVEYQGLVEYCISRRWISSSTDPYITIDEMVGHLTVNHVHQIWIACSDETAGTTTINYSTVVYRAGQQNAGAVFLINEDNQHWVRKTQAELLAVVSSSDSFSMDMNSHLLADYDITSSTIKYERKKAEKATIIPSIDVKDIFYFTPNMREAMKDIHSKYTQYTIVDQTQPIEHEMGIRIFIDPPRSHAFSYRLFNNAVIQCNVKRGRFTILHENGFQAELKYPPFSHDATLFTVGQNYQYERKKVYTVGSEVHLSVYLVTYFEGGRGRTGALVPLKGDRAAAGSLAITEKQKTIIHASLLTHQDRVDKIAARDPAAILDAYAFTVACNTDATVINEEEYALYISRAARQVKRQLEDIPAPKTPAEKYAHYKVVYHPQAERVQKLYRRMLWLKSPAHIELADYINGIRQWTVAFYVCLMLAVILFPLALFIPSWILGVTALCCGLYVLYEWLVDNTFMRWVGRIRGWRKSLGCPNCKAVLINCRWCDFTQDFTCMGVQQRYIPIDQATRMSEAGTLYPMTLDARITEKETTLKYLNNYQAIDCIQPVVDLIKELREQPYEQGPTYINTILPQVYEFHVSNSVVASDYNLAVALFTRQGQYDTQPDEEYLDGIGFGVLDATIYAEAVLTCATITPEKFLEEVPSKKKKLYARSIKSFHRNPVLKNSYRAMCKSGEAGVNNMKTRKARVICKPNDAMVGVAAWIGRNEMLAMKRYWRLLFKKSDIFKCWPAARREGQAFIQGMGGDAITANLNLIANTFENPSTASIDIAKWDAGQAAKNMEKIDFTYRKQNIPLYARLKLNKHEIKHFMRFAQTSKATLDFVRANKYPKFRVRRPADLRRLLRIKAKQTTFSGDPLKTTLGNTNRQLHLIYCMLRSTGLLPYAFAMASGDDLLIYIEKCKLQALKDALNQLYATPGETGKKGSGLIMKEFTTSDSCAKFLSKNVVLEKKPGNVNVHFYRQVDRLLRTGEFSVKATRKDLPPEHFNYMIHEQLREQVTGDTVLEKILTWRQKRLNMTKPGKRAVKVFYDDYEERMKRHLHATTHTSKNNFCATVDPQYALLAAGATPEEILTR